MIRRILTYLVRLVRPGRRRPKGFILKPGSGISYTEGMEYEDP
jgi:hypothetical protein